MRRPAGVEQILCSILPGERGRINYDQVLAALKKNEEASSSNADRYIRDCFDWFFYWFDRIQHYINRQLIDLQDVEPVFRPYAKLIAHDRDTFYAFLDFHEYSLAKEFFENYDLPHPCSSGFLSLPNHLRRLRRFSPRWTPAPLAATQYVLASLIALEQMPEVRDLRNAENILGGRVKSAHTRSITTRSRSHK